MTCVEVSEEIHAYNRRKKLDHQEQAQFRAQKVKESIAKIQPQKAPEVNVSTTAAQGNLKKLQSEVDRTQAKIQELSGRFANIQQARDDYLYDKYSGVFPKGTSQDDIASTFERDPGFQKYKEQLDSLNAQMAPLNERLAQTKAQMAEVGNAASSAAPKTERLGNAAKMAGSHLQSAGRSSGYFGRMVKSMMLSMLLYQGVSFVAKSIAEGFQNMALASGQANATMSALATNGLYLKNSFASAVYPIVQALTPAFTALSNAIAGVLQKIGMFFAALNGKKYITVAKRAQVDYADTVTQSGNDALQAQQKQQAAAEKAAAAQEKASARAEKAQEKAAAAAAKAEKIAAEKTAASQEKAAKQQTAAEARVQKAVENHQKKVDALKKSIMSFDELNILGDTKDTGTAPTVPNYEATTYNPAETAAASVPAYTYTAPAAASAVKWNGMPSPTDMFQQVQIPQQVSDIASKVKEILDDLKRYLLGAGLLAAGAIIACTGNPGVGIAMMVAGAIALGYVASIQADGCFAGIDAAKIEYQGKILTSADFSDLSGRLATVRQQRDTANVQQIVDGIAPHIVGNTFTPYSATVYSNPALEAGDTVDIDGHKAIITNLSYKLNSAETLSCEAKSQAENKSDFYSESEKLWDELQALNTKSEELRIKIQKLADGLESTVSRGDEMSDIKQLYNSIDLLVTNMANKTSSEIKQTANSIITSVNDQVGGLQSQINQQASQIESKVSQTELNSTVSTAIRQSPNDVVFAFNNQSSSQSLKLDGNGFYFYSNGSKIGHLGVTYNPSLGEYGICVQPVNGQGTYFMPNSDYALMCLGRIKAQELAADGMISTPGMVSAGGFKTAQGDVGKTEDMTLKDLDGKNYHLTLKCGLMCKSYY